MESELPITDNFQGYEVNNNVKKIKTTNSIHEFKKITLLNSLKKFNQYFTDNLLI